MSSHLKQNTITIQKLLDIIDNLPKAQEPVLQDKTIAPSTSSQTIIADSGYDGLSKVTVNAMPTATQATPSVSINSSGLITASATQTAGYVSAGTKSGTKQLTIQSAKAITPSSTSQTAVDSGVYTTGAVTVGAIPSTYVKPTATKAATTYTPTTSNQTISAGTYCSGTQTIAGDANLIADNIKSGVSIFGVSGILEEDSGEGIGVEDALVSRTISEYKDRRVTTVGDYAFYGCANITKVNLPNATTIGARAFSGCTSLTTVDLPMATTIGRYVFSKCTNLTTVNLPMAASISSNFFYSCTKLTTVNFTMATTIGSSAFHGCQALTTVSFPNVETIGSFAFNKCINLTTVSFPMATSIYTDAFRSCAKLTTVNFPNVKIVDGYAFWKCTNLTTASFPMATAISGWSCFDKCYNLKSLYLMGSSVCTLSKSEAFGSTPIGGYSTSAGTYGSIYVPTSLLTSYKNATNWTYFSSRFVGI